MIKNYFKIAYRNVVRYKVFSLINILGLAIGMACTILILLWVSDELSYDKFHKNSEDIYLVLRGNNSGMSAVTSKFLAPALKDDLTEIVHATSYLPVPSNVKILIQNKSNGFEENFSLADPDFFKMFSFRFLEGDPGKALTDPYSLIITEQAGKKYFGKESAFGKTLDVTLFGVKHPMKVTGIIEDLPNNSHIQHQFIFPADMLQSFGSKENGWRDQVVETYIKLKNRPENNTDIRRISSAIRACELRNIEQGPGLLYSLLPLTDIHLYGSDIKFLNVNGNIQYVRIFTAVAFIILLIAGINYMNLSIALSFKRTKEVGIKKTVGASRKSLIVQFFGESILLSFISLAVAILIIEIFLPSFNQLSGKSISINYLNSQFIIVVIILALMTGFLSGIFPALFLSSFRPIQLFKGKLKVGAGNFITRKGLVVVQFSLSIILIIGALTVNSQLNFIESNSTGLDKENLICINMTGGVNNNYELLKNELQKNTAITGISRSEAVNNSALSATGFRFKQGEKNEEVPTWVLYTDNGLLSTYKFKMKYGRFFSEQFPTDKSSAFVINETAAKAMGIKSPLNTQIFLRGRLGTIVGIAEDFHFSSFHEAIEPLVFMIPDSSQENGRFRVITIRYKTKQLAEVLSYIENTWRNKLPDVPFNYSFYDESLNEFHLSELRMSSIFEYFSILAILIACTGLLGLISISAEQRTKEIGIRKVLGASRLNIVFILSKEYLVWVLVSNFIAFPPAYYFMNEWLQDYAYRTSISWWMFGFAGGTALFIAITTVSLRAIKVAGVNPVKSLKYE